MTSAASVPAALDAAALAASALAGASIEALDVVVDPGHMMASSEEVSIQQLRALREGSAQERAQAVRAAFDGWMAGRDPGAAPVLWRSVTGAETDSVVGEAAPDVALMVVPHDANMDASDALHAAIFATGKPVILVPPTWRANARTHFAHIAVGLIDDDTMRRAIIAAEPWLRGAGRISAISIEGGSNVTADPAAMWPLATIAPDFLKVPPTDEPTATRLVREADQLDADLLVAGAYGHMELMEWLFGGVTRELLQVADLPLLLAH
ncbi:universal stress protein [Ancylobacter sp. A5.8]|uniref:universal stress protein n=1 Tax=Ancylobacter gelatini TaxID=2919920 RepID=UPI001F4D923E|nr:universal stress protein [Ancylobacter gelatini]MCJ8143423.1 universal stress protein [Ancylobacter gelatini]